ncbi:MAG: apolipoprotein N-acyltransferase, partial [Candidatus Binatia bacterium]
TLSSIVLYSLSFPPFSIWPLMWGGLAPFFIAVVTVRPASAAVLGVLWGAGMFYGVFWCFPWMLANYFNLSFLLGWIGLFAVGLVFSGMFYGAFAFWLSWLSGHNAANPLVVAAGWGVCEFARVHFFISNPWALSGYSQVALTQVMQIADATGPYGIGMLLAAVNVCLAGALTPTLRAKRFSLSIVGVIVVLGGAFMYGKWRLSQTFTSPKPFKVAIVQAAIDYSARFDLERQTANFERYRALTLQAAQAQPTIIFWPEYAVNFHLQEETPERDRLIHLSREVKADLIVGGPHYEYGAKELIQHNSVFLIHNGRLAGRYDKMRLLPLAEANHFGGFVANGLSNYKPGKHIRSLRTERARVGVFLCFEAMFPDLVRRFARQGAEVLANPSNDDWLEFAAPARQQLDVARVRAIENRRYLIRPTPTGFSAVIDPYGRVISFGGFGDPAVLVASVAPLRVRTLYQQWGDMTSWIAVTLVATASLLQLKNWKLKDYN